MTRVRIAGAVLLVLLGGGLLTRITDHRGTPPKNPIPAPVAIRTDQTLTITETVDLRNGNVPGAPLLPALGRSGKFP